MFLAKISDVAPWKGVRSGERARDQQECDTAADVYVLPDIAVYSLPLRERETESRLCRVTSNATKTEE